MSFLETVKNAGVVGAGGAGFPTYAKLDCRADYVLVNGAECEPLLRVDQLLMARYPDDVILGAKRAAQEVGAGKTIIGVKGKHKEVIELLERRMEELHVQADVSVGILPDIYPAGDEVILVYQLTGRIVPEMGLPKDVGCVVINAETCVNLRRAEQGLPVTEKYLTLAGDVPAPKTVRVPVGMPIKDVIRMSGVDVPEAYAVIRGGPMMGSLLEKWDDSVTKKDKGFIILKKDHPLIRKKSCTEEHAGHINRSACEQCRMCTDLCPRFLLGHHMEPHKMMRALCYAPNDASRQPIAALCSQCNLCEYFSCPANLHPRMTNALFRKNLAEAGLRYQPQTHAYQTRTNRRYRLVPSKRLIARLGLREFDRQAPWTEESVLPEEVRIATKQNAGAAAKPVVYVGQSVRKNEVIGKVAGGALGVPIHASIDGIVTACDDKYIVIKRGR